MCVGASITGALVGVWPACMPPVIGPRVGMRLIPLVLRYGFQRSADLGWVEVSADPPPQSRCSVIIRQRLAVRRRAQQLSGVDPGTRDCGQPLFDAQVRS